MRKLTQKDCLLRIAQSKAKSLQENYNELEAPPTQNVRNPFPMWALVECALPTIQHPDTIVDVKVTRTAVINGKLVTRKSDEQVPIKEILGNANFGLTVNEIVAAIRNQGFIAKKTTVAMTISNLVSKGIVGKVRQTRKSIIPGRKSRISFCTYFLQQV